MKIYYDKIKILEILNDFSNCTKITASFKINDCYINDYISTSKKNKASNINTVDYASGFNPCNHFCTYLKSQIGNDKCLLSNLHGYEIVKNNKKLYIYSCFAGLCEVILPITIDNILVGFVMCGMFIDAEHKYSSLSKVSAACKKFELDKDKMIELYNKLPIVSRSELYSALNILQLCISTVMREQLLGIKSKQLVDDICYYIMDNITKPLTIESICSHFIISRQSLHKLFKVHYNTTPKQFITTEKFKKAQNLLLTTNKSIREISDELGFFDYNYFIRAFRNNCKIAPLQYRKQHTKSTPPQHI